MAWLNHCIIVLVIAAAAVVTGMPTCPSDQFVKERMNATNIVVESVIDVLRHTNSSNSSILNSTTTVTVQEIYELIAMNVNAPISTEGLVEFRSAINEIAVAIHRACSMPEDSRVQAEDVRELISRFVNFTTAGNISKAREVYGMQLCLRDLLSTAINITRTPEEVQARNELDDFFDSLDGEETATLFGIEVNYAQRNPPTLAFVVDDTGSMSEEISSVQRLIRSFIRTERTRALAYILTTFNDPGN